MPNFPEPIENAIKEISKLPGIGKKSALRIVYYLLKEGHHAVEALETALEALKNNVEMCPKCRGYKETSDECKICSDPKRDNTILCIVESTQDMHLIDSSAGFKGNYFVLHGLISPLKGATPESLKIGDLKKRVEENGVLEIIIATPYTAEGEATASYIQSLVESESIKISRIGMGIPIGSELSYVDSETLSKALALRREIK
ncbi:MAG: recombination mediator RecR [Acidobacteria bacterium]|nr:recombination mediator RecR [Acidobacteriota bacterium]